MLRNYNCQHLFRSSRFAARGEFRDPEIAERDVGRRVVPLDHDGARFKTQALARVGVRAAIIQPIDHLITVHPRRNVSPIGNHRLEKPFLVIRDDQPCVDPTKDSARATIDRLAAVALLDAIVDLTFVSIHRTARNTPKEDARIQLLGICDAFSL